MNSSILWLNEYSFSSEDTHYFLKNWMIRGDSNLSHLVLEFSTEIEKDAIFNELLIEQKDEEMEFELAGSEKVAFNSSYELKRLKDGAIALILLRDEARCEFRMIVWNPIQEEE
ncbi:hypothetical protein CAEBREN_19212 [Caenorhabditis brenneri]|uniref:F-box associated domain-containing protein n=1 Tax=Caenorhabditis brenneri TaxID=135651 RepID=G0NJY6_CAEBE|nr:hypothetical protein CAEBREN_19212 [Caenorhabditis brenneri]